MKSRYVLHFDQIFPAVELTQQGSVVILEDNNGTVVRHSASDVFLTELDAKVELRSRVQQEVQLESQNAKSAAARLDNAISRLVDLNSEIFNIKHSK
jgi:hypothetical protein